MKLRISKYYQSWKDVTNNKVTIVPKNIKNDIPNNITNYTPWNDDCAIKKYKFNANPIKHYRKQYTNINLSTPTFSKLSLIGCMDKPGGTINSQINENDCTILANNSNLNIITCFDIKNNCKTNVEDKFYDPESNKMQCTSLSPEALVIKRATTVLSQNYSSSHREYLYNKCKTYSQNLPSQQKELTLTKTCNNLTTCITFNPSNKTFQTQGPVTSSARTYSLKYGCLDGASCNKKVTLNNCPSTMSREECATLKKLLNNPSAVCIGCINDPSTIRRKRINILK
jgi:hypothetical protein